jgi:hypothetical protein
MAFAAMVLAAMAAGMAAAQSGEAISVTSEPIPALAAAQVSARSPIWAVRNSPPRTTALAVSRVLQSILKPTG